MLYNTGIYSVRYCVKLSDVFLSTTDFVYTVPLLALPEERVLWNDFLDIRLHRLLQIGGESPETPYMPQICLFWVDLICLYIIDSCV